jgi:hypothetical protein
MLSVLRTPCGVPIAATISRSLFEGFGVRRLSPVPLVPGLSSSTGKIFCPKIRPNNPASHSSRCSPRSSSTLTSAARSTCCRNPGGRGGVLYLYQHHPRFRRCHAPASRCARGVGHRGGSPASQEHLQRNRSRRRGALLPVSQEPWPALPDFENIAIFPQDDDTQMRAAYESDNLKANEFLFRRVDLEDAVSAHLAAARRVRAIGFGRYITSARPRHS